MPLTLNAVRITTLTDLYAMHDRGSRDVYYLDVLDTALYLTLGEKRAADCPDTLLRNVLRDARRTVSRSQKSARNSAATRPLPDAIHRRVCQIDGDGAEAVELIVSGTPEEWAIVSDTIERLAAFAATLGAHGPLCLQGLLQGRSGPKTALSAGVSLATVERAWKALRAHTRVLLADAV
ncbi:hypothetical protein [Streptosporangium sandarakinum]